MWLFIFSVLFLLYVLACAILILVVLNQEPKGSGVGAMFGQGSAMGDALGVAGMQRTLRVWTRNAAITFGILSIVLALVGGKAFQGSVLPPSELPSAMPAPALTDGEPNAPEAQAADGASEATAPAAE